MGVTVTTRISNDLSKDIMIFAKQENVDRSTEVRQLLAEAVKQKKIKNVLERYKKKEITIGKAAELAGMGLREMLSLASDKEISFQYTLKDLRDDLEAARK